MLNIVVSALFVIICFLLQCTVFNNLSFGGIIPNLMIIVTASYGFMRGRKSGLLVGFFSGLLMDIFFNSILGFYALIYMYIGYLNGIFRKMFYPEDIKLPIALIVVSDLTFGISCYLLQFLLRGKFDFPYYFVNVILPEAVYTIIVTIFIYPLILKMNVWLESKEKRSEQKFV